MRPRRMPLALPLALSLFCVDLTYGPADAHAATPTKPASKAKGTGKKRPQKKAAAPRPVANYTRDGFPNIQAQAAIIVDLGTGKVLHQKNPDEVRSIASVSKLMAMMVVLDRRLDLDGVTEMLPADRDAARRGAKSRLPTGMTFTNRDLLHAALMASDNRAVPALGRAVGLTVETMTAEMNKKARSLGLGHTHFGDPTGLNDANVSTPREVAKFLGAALRYALITEITQKSSHLARSVDKPGYSVEYGNTDLIARGQRYQVLAGKTGYTDKARYCLAIAARLDSDGPDTGEPPRDVAMVFLGAEGKLTRFGDFSRCAQWFCEKKGEGGRTTAAKTTSL